MSARDFAQEIAQPLAISDSHHDRVFADRDEIGGRQRFEGERVSRSLFVGTSQLTWLAAAAGMLSRRFR